ncbi:MAG: anthranilate synthase component 1 [Planctomycetota bacterium]|nr:anthranilate synthase component 1 [Planctomycetota bacterium]
MDAPRELGEVLPLSRSLSVCPDPLVLFQSLTTDASGTNKNPAILLESADSTGLDGERSLIISRACLHIWARNREVFVKSLGFQGSRILLWIARQFPQAQWSDDKDQLSVEFPPLPTQSRDLERLKAPSPIDVLRVVSQSWTLLSKPAPLSFLIAGTFSFDLLGVYESLPETQEDSLETPDFEFWLPEELVIVDHKKRSTRVLSFVFGGQGSDLSYHDAARRIEELSQHCRDAVHKSFQFNEASQGDLNPDDDQCKVDTSDEDFAKSVIQLKEHIYSGDVYQIVLSRTFQVPCDDSLVAYARLRTLNPSPYMFYFRGPKTTLFGASPETAVKVSGSPKLVEICPIAGTRKRGKKPDGQFDKEIDSRLELELLIDKKELAEHIMLVDLARNDVARVSKAGTRSVEKLLTVERYSHVMHLVSNVVGELRDDLDALNAYVATMNMGTLVGAPKIKAASLLRHYESQRRGPYGGGVGYLSSDGEMDTSIVIRSAIVKDGQAYVRAGAGVVHDSDPMLEADETRRKAAAVLRALGV